ncbi:MAG TPA: DUF1232 domain-containing protein [Mycobacteriales bacterium]|nr:DUF1232 domain-containing protein [Mycobacteriales bacterium]
MTWEALAWAAGAVGVLWLLLVLVLLRLNPGEDRLRDAIRLLPDVLRLVGRLAKDPAVPRRTRVTLWLVLAYLALPMDLVPDFVPVVGYADDAVLVAWALRSVVRTAGRPALERHWPGTPQGLRVVQRLAGLQPE